MYASAAYAVIWAICAVLIVDRGKNPFASLTFGSETGVAAIGCVIQVTVWLWLARACRPGGAGPGWPARCSSACTPSSPSWS